MLDYIAGLSSRSPIILNLSHISLFIETFSIVLHCNACFLGWSIQFPIRKTFDDAWNGCVAAAVGMQSDFSGDWICQLNENQFKISLLIHRSMASVSTLKYFGNCEFYPGSDWAFWPPVHFWQQIMTSKQWT